MSSAYLLSLLRSVSSRRVYILLLPLVRPVIRRLLSLLMIKYDELQKTFASKYGADPAVDAVLDEIQDFIVKAAHELVGTRGTTWDDVAKEIR